MKLRNKLITTLVASVFSISAVAATTNQTMSSQQTNQQQSNSFTPQQQQAIKNIVKQYLISNPEILVEASKALQAKQLQKAQKDAMTAIQANKQQLFNNPASPTAGNPNGNTVVVEFFDYQCGHCKRMGTVIESAIKQDKNLKVIFKELPIFGKNSQFAAKAALASVKQGKYYQFHDALLAASNPLSNAKVLSIAKKVGLNVNQLKKDMDSKAVNQQIRDNFTLARNLKLMGTPAFVVANKQLTQFRFIPGAVSLQDLQSNITAVNNGQ